MLARKPCPVRFIGQRMPTQELRQHGQRIAGARVVFHGARTERIELGVDAEILLLKRV
jgi:hypothetical protein